MRVALVAGALVVVVASVAIAWPADEVDDFKTTAAPLLVPLDKQVQVDPILTAGDVVGGELGGYQMSAIPDGIGLYRSSGSTVEVFMNHELAGMSPAAPQGVGARVTHATLDDERNVLRAEYVFTGLEGFERFCSSNLAVIDGVPWYFTGEESTNRGFFTPNPNDGPGRGGAAIAMNALTGRWYEARHWGLFEWEQPLYVGSEERFAILGFEDGPAGRSQLYVYTADSLAAAIAGDGQLSVWAADGPTDDNPSTNDIAKEGDALAGHFEPISTSEWNPAVAMPATALQNVSQTKGAFDFVRLEDGARSKTDPNAVYFADTGAGGNETAKGRLYRLDLDPSDPTRASLTLLVDGDDRGDEMINPDNLDTSAKSVVINENRIPIHRGPEVAGGFARILVYDIRSGEIRTVARTDSPNAVAPGDWESSGIVNAFDVYGPHWWLVDVQAPGINGVPQPGPDLEVNSSTGQSGQLLAIQIPNS